MRTRKLKVQNFSRILYLSILGLGFTAWEALAQGSSFKVDFNFDGRREAEVHEPGHQSWPIGEGKAFSKSFDQVKVTVKGDLSSNWYKAGIQPPHNAKLANDGLVSDGPVELIIEGLPEGKHTLLTHHNTFDNPENNTFAPLNVFVDGDKAQEKIMPSNRVGHNIEAETAYVKFEVKNGEPVVFRFEVDGNTEASVKEVVINGWALNLPNPKEQARLPRPFDGDEHVETADQLTLTWEKAPGAVSHEVYFGKNKEAVAGADHDAPEYKGKQTGNSYSVKDLYSMDTYFWRVDEVNADGEVTKGNVWYFRPAQLAFPGAEGYGRFARGGRGGQVVEVTNLNDDGPGSLREAVTNDIGPRIIVFNVSGEIKLKSRLVASQPYVTIAGQTAPGKGIVVTGAPVGLTGDDGIIRFLRVRIGAGRTYDGMGLTGANHSIIDHSSISWTIDESFSSRGAHNITLQRTLIAEALNVANHGKYEGGKMHGYAATIGGSIGSFHHNLLAHCYGRNWSLGGGVDGNGYYTGKLDIRNNVVYNWGKRTTDGGAREVNFVNNYYKPGAATEFFYALKAQHEGVGAGKQQYYFAGNVMPGHFGLENQEDGRTIQGPADYDTYLDRPFFPSHVTTQSAKEAYKHVLSDVGANQPVFDKHDQRIIQETLDGTYKYKGSKSGYPGMPDTEQDVGGLEKYPKERRGTEWDSDHDGLPNWWEEANGLNPNSPQGDFSDTNQDENRDGFTQMDEYLDWMAKPHYFIKGHEKLNIELEELFKGFEDNPRYAVAAVRNGKANIKGGKLEFQAAGPGLATFELTVTDAEGDSMSRQVGVYVKKK